MLLSWLVDAGVGREDGIQAAIMLQCSKKFCEICFHLLQASAFQVEEELKEHQREKAASLRRFQGEVKQRVNQQVRMRRKQQLQKSCEAVSRSPSLPCQESCRRNSSETSVNQTKTH